MKKSTRTILVRAGLAAVAVAIMAMAGFLWWALTPLGPAEDALAAMRSDAVVIVDERPEGITFVSADETPTVGLILYPGARVDVRSYAPLAREIAERGYLVVLVPMRLNLATLSPDRADRVIETHPEIVTWAIGGHSLGGAMAARYAARHPDRIAGLVMMAAYPPKDADLRGTDMPATSIVGTRDGVLDREVFVSRTDQLPEDTSYVSIEGGNHAQFGSYGAQPGDSDASIPPEDQRWDTVIAIGDMLLPMRIKAQ